MQDAQIEAGLGRQKLTARGGFGLAGLGQIDVDPAGESVLGVPGGLAVAKEDEIKH